MYAVKFGIVHLCYLMVLFNVQVSYLIIWLIAWFIIIFITFLHHSEWFQGNPKLLNI